MGQQTREDVLKALDELLKSLIEDPDSWENPTLERYLEAIRAWLEGYGKKYDPAPSWELIIKLIKAGKIYE